MQFDSTAQFQPRPPPAIQDILKALEIGASVTAETALTALLKRKLWDTLRNRNVVVKLSQLELDDDIVVRGEYHTAFDPTDLLAKAIDDFVDEVSRHRAIQLRGGMKVEIHTGEQGHGSYTLVWSQRYQVADAGGPAGAKTGQEAHSS